jgi:acyl carrier protein
MNKTSYSGLETTLQEESVSVPALNGRETILLRLIAEVTVMINDADRDFPGPLSGDTLLMAGLGCQSLDIVVLSGKMSRQLNRRNIPFEKLLLTSGRPVSDISLGALADFLWEQVKDDRVIATE